MIEVSTEVDRAVDLETTIETAAVPEDDLTATLEITGATDVTQLAGRPSATALTRRPPGDETELTEADELAADDGFPIDEPTRDDELRDDES